MQAKSRFRVDLTFADGHFEICSSTDCSKHHLQLSLQLHMAAISYRGELRGLSSVKQLLGGIVQNALGLRRAWRERLEDPDSPRNRFASPNLGELATD